MKNTAKRQSLMKFWLLFLCLLFSFGERQQEKRETFRILCWVSDCHLSLHGPGICHILKTFTKKQSFPFIFSSCSALWGLNITLLKQSVNIIKLWSSLRPKTQFLVSQKRAVQWYWSLFLAGEKAPHFIPYCGKVTRTNFQLKPTCVFMSPKRGDSKKSLRPVIQVY